MRILLTASICLAAATSAFAGDVDLPRHPSLSPDGADVVFSWRGDLWKVPSRGGHAVRLTSHTATETKSAWSPDGRRIAFQSDRDGFENLWVMDADGGNVRRVTDDDTGLALTDWSADGTEILFGAGREGDVFREPRPYAVSAAGGPVRRVHDAFGREPVESADGKRVLFTRGGSAWSRRGYRGPDSRDVWMFDVAAKSFRRLTTWEGNDGRAAWTSSGEMCFLSDRNGKSVEVYRRAIDAADDTAQRVTDFGGADVWDLAVARDGRSAVVVVGDALHRIDLATPGAKPERIAITAPEDEAEREETIDASDDVSEAALSPDGKVLAVVAYGEVFVRNVEDKHPTARVTTTIARERGIAWSPDGEKLYFSADVGGKESIFAATVTATRTEIREAYEKALKPPEAPKPAPAKPETPKGETPKPETPKTEPAKPETPPAEPKPEPKPEKKDDDEKAGDDDEKPAAKKPAAKRTPADRWQDAIEFKVDLVVPSSAHDREPMPSPDGKSLLFRRGLGDLVVFDLAAKTERVLVRGWDASIDFRWSPDSRHVAYNQDDVNFNSDVWIVRADGSSPAVNISRHPANDRAPRWSADGKVLVFLSERIDREYDVWRVNLDAKLDTMSPLETAEYFKEAGAAAKKRKPLPPAKKADGNPDGKPTDAKPADGAAKGEKKPAAPAETAEPAALDLADAWKRLVRLTTMRGSETSIDIAPSGEQVYFRGKDGPDEGLFSIGWDGKGQKKLTATGALQMVSLTGDTLVLVNAGRAATLPAAGGAPKTLDVDARFKVDRGDFAEQKFREAARIVGECFYHPTLKGLDWPALTERYAALARRTRTAEEFDAIAAYLLGELNGSHLGVSSRRRGAASGEPNGRLGVVVDPVPAAPGNQAAPAFRVRSVVPYGPADRGPMKLLPGDVVTAVEGAPFQTAQSFEAAFAGRVGRETRVSVRREKDGKPLDLQLFLTPVAWGTEVQLRYDAWCAANEAKVHELSKGRLGYLHIRAMDDSSLQNFERDLYAAAEGHEGLVLDVRNNGGGSTADLVLASLMVQPHAYTTPRGGDPKVTTGYPRDRLFIQRYVLPANLLCNEKSFSNAEILSHAFRTLKRGTLVGQRTYGGVISTGGTSLLDGTSVRMPFRGWYLPDGSDMENNGAVPDLLVPQTPEAESRGDDEQLRAAVDDLVRRLPAR